MGSLLGGRLCRAARLKSPIQFFKGSNSGVLDVPIHELRHPRMANPCARSYFKPTAFASSKSIANFGVNFGMHDAHISNLLLSIQATLC